ncbi:MAG: hypothetical protein LBH19_06430 [Dysgonamonadaceae bacterium]|jgi:hypothetical protein|nr:hypothetical protein [Dysgonamonadaceae bacterium]
MKKIYILIVMISMSSQLLGQNTNQLNEMIVESLRSYINYSSELQEKVSANCKKSDTYICRDGLPAYFPYDSLKNTTFFSVYFSIVYSHTNKLLNKQLKKGIGALFVSFELKDSQLKITITSKSVKLMNKKTIGLGLSDWGNYFYEYSCEKQEWELKEIKYGGV